MKDWDYTILHFLTIFWRGPMLFNSCDRIMNLVVLFFKIDNLSISFDIAYTENAKNYNEYPIISFDTWYTWTEAALNHQIKCWTNENSIHALSHLATSFSQQWWFDSVANICVYIGRLFRHLCVCVPAIKWTLLFTPALSLFQTHHAHAHFLTCTALRTERKAKG